MNTNEQEAFHFMKWGFDIGALRELLQRTTTPPAEITIQIKDATRLLESDPSITPPEHRTVPLIGVDVLWDHVDKLSPEALNAPLFVAPMGEIGQMVIDGWHRIALARRRGIEELPALLFTRRQIQRVLLPRSSPLPPERKDD